MEGGDNEVVFDRNGCGNRLLFRRCLCFFEWGEVWVLARAGLDSEGEDESEEQAEPQQDDRDDPEEVVPEPKVCPHEVFHRLAGIHFVGDVSELGGHHSVQCPRDRTNPVVPSPPDRDPLFEVV